MHFRQRKFVLASYNVQQNLGPPGNDIDKTIFPTHSDKIVSTTTFLLLHRLLGNIQILTVSSTMFPFQCKLYNNQAKCLNIATMALIQVSLFLV